MVKKKASVKKSQKDVAAPTGKTTTKAMKAAIAEDLDKGSASPKDGGGSGKRVLTKKQEQNTFVEYRGDEISVSALKGQSEWAQANRRR